ncbi:MAG TPA: carboxypeptidase regulatory-like domain-containing protein [Edaphobacter sp.]|nr:carboxypeptidase regulatory-like domain-containing protein [Edaphobacter sp.]
MKKLFGSAIVLISMATMSFGQVTTVNGGSIQGTITDPSGAIVSGAKITVVANDTSTTRNITTDASGIYVLGPLVPGNYTVKIEKEGFTSLSVKTVVRTGTVTNGNFKLSIGESTTTVEVTVGAVQVNTEQTSVSDVISQEQIKNLPVNGRNFLDLAQIEPGVILQSGESFDPTKAGYSAISVGGVSGRSTRILLDGQDITDETVGTTIFNVSQGAINEFQLNRSNQDVSGDVTSTGQVLVSTNSGTNAFHGQLFGQFQDHRALFARATNGADPQFQRNQFGGSVGGPILKNKLYFFGNAERIKQDSAAVSTIDPAGPFGSIYNSNPTIPTPYRETYSTARLDYDGPLHGHYFVRGNYNVNAVTSNNDGQGYWLFANRDNTWGLAGGADYQFGRFTHSFRISYEKFHNLLSDATAGNSSIYNAIPGFAFYNTALNFYSGPNYLAPQGTFQSDKQFRYDGSWTKGRHTIRFGYSLNRILGGGFASFMGLGPRVSENVSSLLPNCHGDGVSAPCPDDPVNGYHPVTAIIGNGQGFFTENSGFGQLGGGVFDWRQGAYIADSWKVTPSFTLTAGVRWSSDTGRANQDLAQVNCSDVDPSLNPGCSGSQSLFAQWDPSLAGKTKQNWANFGPQIGFVFSPGDHKTAIRAGFGIYYENDVFNNTTNLRTGLLKNGAFNSTPTFCSGGGTYSVNLPDGSTVSSVNGVSIQQLCNSPMSVAGPAFIQLEQQLQTATKADPSLPNVSYVGNQLAMGGQAGSIAYGAPYRTPYAEQWSFGVQRELGRGIVVSADYIHNSTLKFGQVIDFNHVGAARYLDATAAKNAIASTADSFGCAGADAVNCVIQHGGTINDFSDNGLDSGNQVYGGNPAQTSGSLIPAVAFPGKNPLLGNGNFMMPIGRSGYDALQIVYKQSKNHPTPGINSVNIQGSYSLSRVVSSYGAGSTDSSDQFFGSAASSWDYDNPTLYMGRSALDHKHQMTMAAIFNFKYGPRLALTGQFRSAAPTNLTLDNLNGGTAGIFTSDVTGDGTVGDIAPGTLPGAYMHDVKPTSLQKYVTNFNQTKANSLTPAGKALVSAGLMTPQQLIALGGAIQPIAALPQQNAIANPTFRNIDASFAYPISLAKLREGMSLEPVIAFYNVFNMANYSIKPLGTLENTTSAGGAVNGDNNYLTGPNTYAVVNANRAQRGSGTFNQGSPRTTEFQLKFNF